MERRDCMKHWLISTNYKRRLVDNEFGRPAFILNAQAFQRFPPTLFLRHLLGIWEFAGFDMKNYAFQKIDWHNSSHQYSNQFKNCFIIIWNILKLKTWILSGRLSQNISLTDPFQCFVFLCGHSSKGSLYLSNGNSSAFSFYHLSQSLSISSSSM